MTLKWYYNLEGAQYGPADEAEIIRRIQSAELPPGLLVCRHGESNWQPARNHACFQVEVYPQRPRAGGAPVVQSAAPRQEYSGPVPQVEIVQPPVSVPSSGGAGVWVGVTVLVIGLILGAVLYFSKDDGAREDPQANLDEGNDEDPFAGPLKTGIIQPPKPKPPPPKTDWRELHRQRFAGQAALVADLKRRRGAMMARIRASEDGKLIDAKVLAAMDAMPMELFCPAEQYTNVYTDGPVPIGYQETISQPTLTAMMLTLLKVKSGDRVLEVKTASGYQTALLAHMGAQVYSLETDYALARVVRPTMDGLGFDNLHYEVGGDAYAGLPAKGPFDCIIATAAYPSAPFAIFRQLKPGGRMLAPVGDPDCGQTLMLYFKTAEGEMKQLEVLPVAFSMMPK